MWHRLVLPCPCMGAIANTEGKVNDATCKWCGTEAA
jgi:hypothetical protein